MATKPARSTKPKAKSRTRLTHQRVRVGAGISDGKRVTRERRPDGMTIETWQTELRRQFGRAQAFLLKNVGDHPIFSEFLVTNPERGTTYRVIIRGIVPGENACTCADFATNTLGTCKHVEFALAKLSRSNGAAQALAAPFCPEYSEIVLRYGSQRTVCWRPGTECPAALTKLARTYFGDEGSLHESAFARVDKFIADAARLDHDVRCRDDALSFIAEVRDATERHRRIDSAFPRGAKSKAVDTLVKATLYDYQREGALFAARAGRCLLGDDMGLGKTVQAIAAAEIMARHLGVARVLVVCPTSLKHQWEREISRFTERTAIAINGLRTHREAHFEADSFFKITNYDTIYRDLDLIAGWSPDLVILDEAQRIKNWSTRTARSVKRIASPFAIVLTGTPLENRLEELVSIVEFVDRYRLGPTFRLLDRHQTRNEDGRVIGYRDLDELGRTLKPILLRRRKSEVLAQLPKRLDQKIFVAMTPEQSVHHEEHREIVARIVRKWRAQRFLSEADQRRLLVALQCMRMSCDSTYLLDQTTDHGMKADELMTLLGEILERPEQKVVIFSQWTRMLATMIPRLKKHQIDYVFFHGGVPGTQRGALIERFRNEPNCRVFLSTDAGGVGLNLQHASTVVNLDLPWNPAVLEQRIGRVHRIGQTRAVNVINFISKDTIEEAMLSVLSFKSSLFAGVLDGGEKEVFLGGTKLQRFMRTVEQATNAIPEAQSSARDASEEDTRLDASDAVGATVAALPEPSRESDGDRWSGVIEKGVAFLEGLAAASTNANEERSSKSKLPSGTSGRAIDGLVRHDAATGERYVHLPLPALEVLDRALVGLSGLLARMRR